MEAYGTDKPPLIDVKKVRQAGIPMAMFTGTFDELVSHQDSQWLYKELQSGYGDNPKPVLFSKDLHAGHYTFMVGKDMSYMDDVSKLIGKYNVANVANEDITHSTRDMDSSTQDIIDD